MTERLCVQCRKPISLTPGSQKRTFCNGDCRRIYDAARKAATYKAKLAERRECPMCGAAYGPYSDGDGRFTFRQTCGDPVCLTEWKTQAQNNNTEGWPEVTGSPIDFAPWAFADNVDDRPTLGRMPTRPGTHLPRGASS